MRAILQRLAVPLAAVLFLGVALLLESALNRGARPLDLSFIGSDIHNQQLSVAIPIGHGTYGLTGYGPGTYSGGYTDFEWGRGRARIRVSIYTLVACMLAVLTVVAWAGCRVLRSHEEQTT